MATFTVFGFLPGSRERFVDWRLADSHEEAEVMSMVDTPGLVVVGSVRSSVPAGDVDSYLTVRRKVDDDCGIS